MQKKINLRIRSLFVFVALSIVLTGCTPSVNDPKAPTLTTINASSIAATTATTGGNISEDGGASVTARGVCWNTTASPTIANNKTSDGTGNGPFTSSLSGLNPATSYYVRAYATNSTGTVYGNEVTFTTSAAPSSITTTAVTAITSSSATSGGNITTDGGGAVTARGVCWNTAASPTVANFKTTDATGTGTFISAITGLTSGTTYYVRAYATNSAGTSYGNEVTFTCSKLPMLTTISTSAVTSTTAASGGTITSDGGATVTARGVCWGTVANPTITNAITSNGTGIGNFTSSLTGLTASTRYYVRAYATNNAGTAYGQQEIFVTNYGTMTDIDGNIYPTIQIGTQVWSKENLKVTKLKDGTAIPLITDNSAWMNLTTNGYCWYDNDAVTNRNLYGGLYNYNTVNTGKLCPTGWHVPSDSEWTILTDYLTNNSYGYQGSGNDIAKSMAATSIWITNTEAGTVGNDHVSNNSSGFSALPGGVRHTNGAFEGIGAVTYWWSPDEPDFYGNVYRRVIVFNQFTVERSYGSQMNGFSVRCVTGEIASLVLSTTATTIITSTSAVSGGNITSDGGKTITERGVCWSTTANPTTANSKTTEGTGIGSFTSNITGLTGGTTYYVKAYATNSAGTAYGNQVTFTTSASNNGIIFNPNLSYGSMTDAEGNVYKTITIGTQLWMAENLKTTKYNDGTAIPLVTDNNTWANLTTPAYCWYNNDATTYKSIYGARYNWYSVSTGKLCPTGWHVPTDAEWTILTSFLGGESVSGAKMKETGTSHWGSPNTGATNESGFSAIPNGHRYDYGAFGGINDFDSWWSSTESTSYNAWYRYVYFDRINSARNNGDKPDGFSVRCISGNLGFIALSTASISNITSTSAISGGNISSDGGIAVAAKGVCWSMTSNPTTANTKTSDGTGTGSFTSSITGLNAGTTYYLRSYAINSTGTVYGNEVSFKTNSILSQATVTTTAASNITTSVATLGGSVTSDGNATVTERGIVYATTQNPTIANTKVTFGMGTGNFTGTISGLTSGMTYYVRAYATNSAGTSYGNGISFTTTAAAQSQWEFEKDISTGANSSGIAITPDNSKIIVTNNTSPGTIKVISTSNYAIANISYPADGYPNGVTVTPDGLTAIVNTMHQTIYINLSTNSVIGNFAAPCVATTLYGIAVNASSAYYPDLSSGCTQQGLRFIQTNPPTTSSSFIQIPTTGQLFGIALTGNSAIVTAWNAAPVNVNLSSSAVQKISGMTSSFGVAILHSGNEALIEGDSLNRVSLNANKVTSHLSDIYSTSIQSIAITADDKYAFVVGAFKTIVVSLSDNAVIQTFSTGGTSVATTSDGSKFFITNSYNGTVSIYKKK